MIKSISYVTIGLIIGRLAAFVKHAIIVKYAGISFSADVFFVANTIPETVVNVILAGILTGVFIPLASQELAKRGNSAFKKFINSSLYFLVFTLLLLAILLYIFADKISHFIAPGYAFQQQYMIANILKIFSPGIFFIGMAAILTGTLQSVEKFLVPSFGLFIANSTTIICTILLFKKYGIYAAAIGTSLGFFLWFISQIPFTFKYFRPIVWPDIKEEAIRKLINLTIPTILIIAISNLVLVIEKIFASRFLEGTITQLNLAFRLAVIFSNVLVLPLGTVLLPKMSKQYTKQNLDKLYEIIKNAFLVVSILLFVVIIIVLINAQYIATIIYAPLGISNTALIQIGEYLRIYTFAFLGLFFYPIVLRVFFSTQKVKYLLAASILGILSYTAIIIILISQFHSYVLPLGYGIFYFIIILYLFWAMKKKIFPNSPFFLNKSIFQMGLIFIGITIAYIYFTVNSNFELYMHFVISIILTGSFLFLIRKYISGKLIPYVEFKE